MKLYIANKNYSSWSMRPWVMLKQVGIEFEEVDIELVPEAAELVGAANNGNYTVPTLIFSDGTAMTNPSLAKIREHLGV